MAGNLGGAQAAVDAAKAGGGRAMAQSNREVVRFLGSAVQLCIDGEIRYYEAYISDGISNSGILWRRTLCKSAILEEAHAETVSSNLRSWGFSTYVVGVAETKGPRGGLKIEAMIL